MRDAFFYHLDENSAEKANAVTRIYTGWEQVIRAQEHGPDHVLFWCWNLNQHESSPGSAGVAVEV